MPRDAPATLRIGEAGVPRVFGAFRSVGTDVQGAVVVLTSPDRTGPAWI